MKNKITRSIAVVLALLVGALFFTGILPSFFRSNTATREGASNTPVENTTEVPVGTQARSVPFPVD